MIGGQPFPLKDRGHFVAVASRMMRQILVEYARARRAQEARRRHIGSRSRTSRRLPSAGTSELMALDGALEDLSRIDERQSQIVEMRFFGGLADHGNLRSARHFGRDRRARLVHGADMAAPSKCAWRHPAMTLPPWERVKELLHLAVALEPEPRANFLDEVCASDRTAACRTGVAAVGRCGAQRTFPSIAARRRSGLGDLEQ